MQGGSSTHIKSAELVQKTTVQKISLKSQKINKKRNFKIEYENILQTARLQICRFVCIIFSFIFLKVYAFNNGKKLKELGVK